MNDLDIPNNREDQERFLRDHNAANFIAGVAGARQKADDTVMLTVQAFYREPEVLYVAAEYASDMGVTLIVAPATTAQSAA